MLLMVSVLLFLKLYSYGGELRYVIGYFVYEDNGNQNDAPGIILEVK